MFKKTVTVLILMAILAATNSTSVYASDINVTTEIPENNSSINVIAEMPDGMEKSVYVEIMNTDMYDIYTLMLYAENYYRGTCNVPEGTYKIINMDIADDITNEYSFSYYSASFTASPGRMGSVSGIIHNYDEIEKQINDTKQEIIELDSTPTGTANTDPTQPVSDETEMTNPVMPIDSTVPAEQKNEPTVSLSPTLSPTDIVENTKIDTEITTTDETDKIADETDENESDSLADTITTVLIIAAVVACLILVAYVAMKKWFKNKKPTDRDYKINRWIVSNDL